MKKLNTLYDLSLLKGIKHTIPINNIDIVSGVIFETKDGVEQYFFNVHIGKDIISVVDKDKSVVKKHRKDLLKAQNDFTNTFYKLSRKSSNKMLKKILNVELLKIKKDSK